MTPSEINQLSGTELVARLINRGLSPAQAAVLIQNRKDCPRCQDDLLRHLADGEE